MVKLLDLRSIGLSWFNLSVVKLSASCAGDCFSLPTHHASLGLVMGFWIFGLEMLYIVHSSQLHGYV